MMYIVFSERNSEIRLMYMQNKNGKSACKFKTDMFQLHLLRERKEITSKKLPSCMFGDKRVLADAVLPSVGSYGVFHQDAKRNIEMAFYPACNIDPCRKSGGITRIVSVKESRFGTFSCAAGYLESQGERTLEDFGNALIDMKIGTPILPGSPSFNYIVAFLTKNSPVFQKSFYGRNIDFNNNINASFEEMTSVCIIHADPLNEPNSSPLSNLSP